MNYMKKIKKACKKITDKFDQTRNLKSDMGYTKNLEERYSVSEDIVEYIKHGTGVIKNQLSDLEKIIYKINSCSYNKDEVAKIIDKLKIYNEQVFEKYEEKAISSKNQKVKEEIDNIKSKIKKELSEMNGIVEEYDDLDEIKTLVLNKCLNISSDLGENKHNLGEDFSYLKGAIEEYYNKKETRLKCVAAGTGLAIAFAGIGVGASTIIEYKEEQINEALIAIYGDEESIPESEYNEYFHENGMPKQGATEKIKERLLAEALEDIVNEELEGTEVKNLEFDYYKKSYDDETSRGPKAIRVDGYKIIFYTEDYQRVEIVKEDRWETVKKDEWGDHIIEDEDAKKTRKWLDDLSINDCIRILDDENSKERKEFEKRLENPILEIQKEVLEKELDSKGDEGR